LSHFLFIFLHSMQFFGRGFATRDTGDAAGDEDVADMLGG
jgi:hypothetical protein